METKPPISAAISIHMPPAIKAFGTTLRPNTCGFRSWLSVSRIQPCSARTDFRVNESRIEESIRRPKKTAPWTAPGWKKIESYSGRRANELTAHIGAILHVAVDIAGQSLRQRDVDSPARVRAIEV